MDSEIQKYIDDLINRRLKEIQEVIGPRGSVKDLRTLGARLGSGGLEVSADGTPKSQIEPDGDAFFGSDIDNPETTSLGVFANAQSYNGEDMEAGDLLIGDNSDGVGNAKWDTLTGFLRFRRGSQTRAYMGADGAIYAADGLLQINENGILSNNGGVFAESKPNSSNDLPAEMHWFFGGIYDGATFIYGMHFFAWSDDNLVSTNPSFEDGFTDWTQTGSPVLANDSSGEGQFSAEVNTTNYVSRTFTVTSGEKYLLIIRAKQLTDGIPPYIKITGGTPPDEQAWILDRIGTGAWTRFLLLVTAGDTSLTIKLQGYAGAVRLDEIELHHVYGGQSGFFPLVDSTQQGNYQLSADGSVILKGGKSTIDLINGQMGGVVIESFMGIVDNFQLPSPPAPPAGMIFVYGNDRSLYMKNSDGVVTLLSGGTVVGANIFLGNLSVNTAVNADLKPAGDNTLNLGVTLKKWAAAFLRKMILGTATAPGTPDTGDVALYAKTDKKLYTKDDSGLERTLSYVIDFLGLSDTPDSFTGQANKVVAVKNDESGLEFVPKSTGAGANAFTDLNDAPGTYVGQGNRLVRVKGAENGLEFVTLSGNQTEIEIDFGSAPTATKSFTISDANISTGSRIIAEQSGVAATGKSADENEMDALTLRAVPGTGQFTLYADALFGPVVGKFKVNYTYG